MFFLLVRINLIEFVLISDILKKFLVPWREWNPDSINICFIIFFVRLFNRRRFHQTFFSYHLIQLFLRICTFIFLMTLFFFFNDAFFLWQRPIITILKYKHKIYRSVHHKVAKNLNISFFLIYFPNAQIILTARTYKCIAFR